MRSRVYVCVCIAYKDLQTTDVGVYICVYVVMCVDVNCIIISNFL